MSTVAPPDLSAYQEGPDRYIRFAEEELGIRLTREQRTILRSLAEHRRTIIMSGNGPGKSFGVAIAKVTFLFAHQASTVLGTSGSYSQYVDAVWRPMKQLYRQFGSRLEACGVDVPEPNDSGQPSLELATDWFAKVVSPRDAGDLEGRHASEVLVVIEEADKAYISDEHFDSARSSVTDGDDRMLAVCNPPKDESNSVHERLEGDDWNTIQFSTLDSHNVRVDAGELDAEKIPGITDLNTIREDWEAYNREPWPGLEAARRMSNPDTSEFRRDLDERWYRRRAGVMPPAEAGVYRPLSPSLVESAYDPETAPKRETPTHLGIDVARSGDDTVAFGVHDGHLKNWYAEQGADHTAQEQALAGLIRDWPTPDIAVDAVGEGSGLADGLNNRFGTVTRFKNGSNASDATTYDDKWSESLALFAEFLADGGTFADPDLYEQAKVAARTVTWEEKHLASRGRDGADVLSATPKDDVRDRLGRSPDHFDAALMAVWVDRTARQTEQPSTWYTP
jgi:hypothetical protein